MTRSATADLVHSVRTEKLAQRGGFSHTDHRRLASHRYEFTHEGLVSPFAGILIGRLNKEDDKTSITAIGLASHDSSHALNHLATLLATGHNDREVGFGNVHAFFESLDRGEYRDATTLKVGHR